jgi:hypothetical protein
VAKDQDGRRDDITVMVVQFEWQDADPDVLTWLEEKQQAGWKGSAGVFPWQ